MTALTASQAILPAIHRTRQFLFNRFRWITFLKLAFVASVTEGISIRMRYTVSHAAHASTATPTSMSDFLSHWLWLIGLIFVLVLPIAIFALYLITRLRFAYFHCLVHNTRQIRPGWHLYRAQAIRFYWLNVVVGLCFLLLAASVVAPFAAGIWRILHHTPAGSQPNIALFVSLLLPFFLSVFLLVLVFFAADLVLRDFILPHFALENATSGQAWRAVWARIKAEKAPFFVYALLRLILPIAAVIALFIVLIIPVLVIAAIFVLIGFGIHLAFGAATGASFALEILFEVLLGLIAFAVAFTIAIGAGGPLSTAIREFALLFYGSRYQQLGAVLFPPPPFPPHPTSPGATL